MTNVLAINGSPSMDKGNTAKILGPFLDGTREAGASVELYYAKQLDVKPCTGEFHCLREKPGGQCYIDDNMQSLYPKLRDADILVFATPVYAPLPGEMQNLLNRMNPLAEYIPRNRNGRTRYGFGSDVKISKFVLVSSSGCWELDNFGTVLRIIKEFAENYSVEFSGALLRPHSGSLTDDNPKTKQVLDAAGQAGHQLVAEGKMAQSLLDLISQPLTAEPKWWSQAKEETDDDG